jgi:hypothetical protein
MYLRPTSRESFSWHRCDSEHGQQEFLSCRLVMRACGWVGFAGPGLPKSSLVGTGGTVADVDGPHFAILVANAARRLREFSRSKVGLRGHAGLSRTAHLFPVADGRGFALVNQRIAQPLRFCNGLVTMPQLGSSLGNQRIAQSSLPVQR